MMKLMCGYGVTIFIPLLLNSCSTLTARRLSSQKQSSNLDQVFNCEEGSGSTVFTRLNDGVNDCGDNSDENNDPLLFYTVLHPDQQWDPVLRGFFLRSDRTFRTKTMESCQDPWTLLAARGPYVYFTCPKQKNQIIQMTRNGSYVVNISRPGKEVQALLFDEMTGNAYLLENSRIKLCDENLNFCSILHGRLRHKPMSLAFSADRGFLYWIERKDDTESYIVKAQRDGNKPEIILQNKTDAFEFVTVDQNSDKLYWVTSITKSIYSSSLDGSDVMLIKTGLDHVHTFAVDRDRLYWADQINSAAFTCDIGAFTPPQCRPSRYQSSLSQNQIGQNIIIYVKKNKSMREVCASSLCSHLCTYVSKTDHTCFCDTSSRKFMPNINNGFCEGITVIAARGKDVYVIGLKDNSDDHSYSPIIRKTKLKNVDSISTIVYDSIQGRIILTENLSENIYAWKPGNSDEVELITYQEGKGTINSLEFDDAGNNIYWISPSKSALQVTSCLTNKTAILIASNSSSFPFDFTLAPNKGYMFILFKTNKSIHLERISMNGDTNTRKVLHHFKHSNTTELSLHYMRSKGILLLMDRLNNNILYSELKPFKNHTKFEFLEDGDMNTFESITSLDESVIWTEANGFFRVLDMQMHEHLERRMSFRLPNEIEIGAIKIAGVIASQEFTDRCGLENGNCPDLCLISNETSFVCRCASNISASTCKLTPKTDHDVKNTTPTLSINAKEKSSKEQVEFLENEGFSKLRPIDEEKSERFTHQNMSSNSNEFVGFLELAVVVLCISGIILAYCKFRKNTRKYNVFLGNRTTSQMNMITVTGTNEN